MSLRDDGGYDRLLIKKQADLDHVERRLAEIEQLGAFRTDDASLQEMPQKCSQDSPRPSRGQRDELRKDVDNLRRLVARAKKRVFAPGALFLVLFAIVMWFIMYNSTGVFGAVFGALAAAAVIAVVLTLFRPQQWKLDKVKKAKTDHMVMKIQKKGAKAFKDPKISRELNKMKNEGKKRIAAFEKDRKERAKSMRQ